MTLRTTLLLFALTAAPGRAAEPPAEGERLFAGRVLPLFKAKCLACHGDDPAKLKGGFDLSSRAKMLAGGDSGEPAVIPGKPDAGPLLLSVARAEDVAAMPPKENDKLSPADLAALRRWVELGAPWPAADRLAELAKLPAEWDAAGGVRVQTSGGLSADWTDRRYKPEDLWAYQPLSRPAVPGPAGANPIDAFVDDKLAKVGLAAAPPADARTLIRRLTFDLTGLPPTPEEVAAFEQSAIRDPQSAYAELVDKLLASPHYGEQMARHWLDVTRYADSSGLANDYERGSAWRYRDYVVRSFNADKPYDQFAREQIAGDEIDPDNSEMLVAAGFLRMGAWELTSMEVPKVARQRFLDDVTDAVGQAFLGHMLQCCRCHDHKFDPIPTRDYYRVQAAFATTQPAERAAPFLAAENPADAGDRKLLFARKARLEAELARIQSAEAVGRKKWLAENPQKKGEKPPRDRILSTADIGLERIARKGLERLKWELDRTEPFALSVYSGRTPDLKAITAPFRVPADRLTAGALEPSHILTGGDPFGAAEPVTPGVLSAVPGAPKALPDGVEGRRAALAAWVTSPQNPLAARAMANRIWQGHFGRGLAGSPNNFGATGKKPTHLELLDWLASEFVAGGWSMKKLHRTILLSDAYRRSSRHPDPAAVAAKDPEGTGYAAFTPRRLAAEEIRDAMLAASGELNRAVGGVPVRPELNPDAALQPRQVMGTFAPAWVPSPLPGQRHRRSIYALKLRGLRDPFFEVFNQPSPEVQSDGRDASTVTPQVFALFNAAATQGRALALATRAVQESPDRVGAIDRAFRLAFGRAPQPAEAARCLAHWDAMTERHRTLELPKPAPVTEVRREAVEENTGERFSFTELLDGAAEFVPDPHPADAAPELRGLMEVCHVLLNANEFVALD